MGGPDQSGGGVSGYVYFAAFKPHFIKIGYSLNPLTRIMSISSQSGAPPDGVICGAGNYKVLGVIVGGIAEERETQVSMSDFLVPGCREWFFDGPEIRNAITAILSDKGIDESQHKTGRINFPIDKTLHAAVMKKAKTEGMIVGRVIHLLLEGWVSGKSRVGEKRKAA